jgi:hypothetical protein
VTADVLAPAVEQHLRQLDVPRLRRPVQRGHAVALSRVHVRALLDQGAHRLDVAAHRRVRHGGVGRSGGEQHGEGERPHHAQSLSLFIIMTPRIPLPLGDDGAPQVGMIFFGPDPRHLVETVL